MKNRYSEIGCGILWILLCGCIFENEDKAPFPDKDAVGVVNFNESGEMSREALIQIIKEEKWYWERHLMGIHYSDGTYKKRDYEMEILQVVNKSVRKTSVVYQSGIVVSRVYSENDTTKWDVGKEVFFEDKCREEKDEIGKKSECGYRYVEYGSILDHVMEKIAGIDSIWVIGVTSKNTLSMFRNFDNLEDLDNFNSLVLRFKDED
jgi:hypothetical protein